MNGFTAPCYLWVYEQDGDLCFSSEYSVYAFPKSAFKELRYVEQEFTTPEGSWNKPTPPNAEEYVNSGLTLMRGYIAHSGYISMTLELEGEAYELRAPAYEAMAFAKLTGLTPIK